MTAPDAGARPKPIEPHRSPALAAGAVRLRSGQIFGQANEVHIEHGEAVYRLRITSLGKLILTK